MIGASKVLDVLQVLRPSVPEDLLAVDPGYETDEFGVVHQQDLTVRERYDVEYVRSRYDTIPEKVREMSMLRAGFILGATGAGKLRSVLDIGYGNGDFLRVMHEAFGADCYGLDVSGYPVPDGCRQLEWAGVMGRHFQLVTLFDSLEHMPSLEVLDYLDCGFLAVTAPCFHPDLGADWFRAWKHRRPGEHLHHFSPDSLTGLMASKGYRLLVVDSIEDALRGSAPDGTWNTFTSVFERG